MSLTNDQLQTRLEVLEAAIDEHTTALNNMPTKQQMKALLALRQAEITDLQTRVTALESQIVTLQAFHT